MEILNHSLLPQQHQTFGSPVSKTLEPFTSSDLLKSFSSGLTWGAAAILFLLVGAWLVSVMRQRIYFSANPATTQDPSIVRNATTHNERNMNLTYALHDTSAIFPT